MKIISIFEQIVYLYASFTLNCVEQQKILLVIMAKACTKCNVIRYLDGTAIARVTFLEISRMDEPRWARTRRYGKREIRGTAATVNIDQNLNK
jgi:hypothetical protein